MRTSPGRRRLVCKIARAMQARLGRPRGWEAATIKFEEGDGAYGACPVLRLERCDIALEVWMDRLFLPGSPRRPMLACSFDGEGGDGRALYLSAPSDLRRMVYATPHRERATAYGGAPVVEKDSTDSKYLTLYSLPGDLNVNKAVTAFLAFFRRWRRIVEEVPRFTPPGRAGVKSDGRASVVTGLLGELKALASLRRSARWKGAGRGAHDIECGAWRIEVKAGRGDLDAPQLTLSQIRSGGGDKRLFALVSVPPSAAAIMEGRRPPRGGRIHGVVAENEDDVRAYLNGHGERCSQDLLLRLSAALPHCRATWHHLEAPEGWREAVRGIEEFGRVRGLSLECPVRQWFRRLRGCPAPIRRR